MKYLCFILIFINIGFAQMPFNTSPTWQSTNFPKTSTGCAWADINNDGWLDLVIANGNDMYRQKVVVYFNNNGTISTTPAWQSTDIDYHGHISVGDVNNDGWTDLAVSVYLGAGGFSSKGYVKIYMNNNGTLSSTPSWISADSMYNFSCALGDADNDGYLDLAVACGENYTLHPDQMRIYKNINGTFQTLPYWKSLNSTYAYDVDWADINKDGKLDLVFACEGGQNLAYLNYGDSIGHLPYWSSTDASLYANSLYLDDVNNDGNIDLAISDNKQNGGTGRFKIYLNTGITFSTTPFWTSSSATYGSGIALADVDFDGWKDLVCGGWWTAYWIYKNYNGTFTTSPQWTSSVTSVVEAIKFADYNNDGLDTLTKYFSGNGSRKLFYLDRTPVHKLLKIQFDTTTIPLSNYCFNNEYGWIVLKNAPANGVQVSIKYISSRKLDFAVSNWDNTGTSNFIFKNTGTTGIFEKEHIQPQEYKINRNIPNPFNPNSKITFQISKTSYVQIKVYDINGKEVKTLMNKKLLPGSYDTSFDGKGLSSGAYFVILTAENNEGIFSDSKTAVLLK